MIEARLAGENQSDVDFRIKTVIRAFSRWMVLLVSLAFIIDLFITVLANQQLPAFGSLRLFILLLIQFYCYITAYTSNYRETAFISISSYYLAIYIFPFFSVSRHVEQNFFLPMFLLLIICMLPLMMYNIQKDRYFIIGWISLFVLTEIINFFFQYNAISQSSRAEVLQIIDDHPIIPLALLGTLALLIALVYKFRKTNFEQHQYLNDLNNSLKDKYRLVSEQTNSLKEQRAQLLAIQKQLSNTQKKLEEKVEERSGVLEQQKEELMKYAFINSHLLRAPVTRLKGLVYLHNLIRSQKEKDKIYYLIKSNIMELDYVSESINEVLENKNANLLGEIDKKVKQIYGHN